MKIRYFYPNFKKKVFILSYDDGVTDDKDFIKILNELGFKATFNLNTELMRNEFVWYNDRGDEIKRLPLEIIDDLYEGHEIASHSSTHPYLDNMSDEEIYENIAKDLENIPFLQGFATPFTYFHPRLKDIVSSLGFSYLRCSIMSESYERYHYYYEIKPTVFHLDNKLDKLLNGFFIAKEELATFMLVGHTYDLRVHNCYDKIIDVLKTIKNHDDIINLTTIETVNYLKAIDSLEITKKEINNPSPISLYLSVDDEMIVLHPFSRYILDK